MALHQPAAAPRQLYTAHAPREETISTPHPGPNDRIEESQEWVLFSPSQAASTTTGIQSDKTARTAGLSRLSDFGSLVTRSGQPAQSNLDDELLEDGDLDSLDDGLPAFQESSHFRPSSNQGHGTVLPTHDGLGTFPASSTPVQEQLWQHERYNPKRKHEGSPTRRSSIHRRLDTIEELESQISEEKRMRIEQWRMDQSQALLDEIEKETRRRQRHRLPTTTPSNPANLEAKDELAGTTPKQDNTSNQSVEPAEDTEPLWRRVTRKFIRDVIGIDEPLLSVIVGETLPEDICAIADLVDHPKGDVLRDEHFPVKDTWADRLLHRIARELGLIVNKLSPHPGAFTAASSNISADYAGMPVSGQSSKRLNASQTSNEEVSSKLTPLFTPTIQDTSHNASWGLEEGPTCDADGILFDSDDAERLRKEREYWERELDVKMVFRFLKSRFSSNSTSRQATITHQSTTIEDPIKRADVIRRHHPLVAKAHQPSLAKIRRDSHLRSLRRSTSRCASESVRSGRRPSLVRSGGSSRNYWDIGGSIGSGSAIASGSVMGAWGEV